MNNVLDIFKAVADNEGLKIGALEKALGASKGVLSRAINNDTDVQSKWFLALVVKFPQYDYDQMLKGEFSSPPKVDAKEKNQKAEEEKTGYPDLMAVRNEIRGDLKTISNGMIENFRVLNDGVFHLLKDNQQLLKGNQKVLKFIDHAEETKFFDIARGLGEFLKAKK